jgi:EmrB/QacA subfamily drug resistance transporter
VIVLAVGLVDFGLEQAIVAPALPAIERHYGASPTAGTWLLTGFVLAAAVAIPLAGRLGDQIGRRAVLLGSLGLFALGSLICAIAGSIGLVIAGRVVQGLGAGIAPLALALARDQLQAPRLPAAIGALVAAGTIGSVAGLVLSGLLVDHVSVPAIFWVLLAVAVILIVLVSIFVPESPRRDRHQLDVPGSILLAGALAALVIPISQGNEWGWGSARTVALFVLAAGLMAAFAVREGTADDPLIEPRVLAVRSVWTGNLAMGGLGFSLLISFALVPLLAGYPKATGYGLGLSTTQIGLILVPSGLATLIAGPVGGRLISRTGARIQAACGTLLAAATYVALALVNPSVPALALATVPLGVGVGLALGAITDLVTLGSPPEKTAATLGLNTVTRTVASALGAQIAIAVVTAAPPVFPAVAAVVRRAETAGRTVPPKLLAAAHIPAHSGFTNAFWLATAASVIALLAVALTPSRSGDPVVALASAIAVADETK